MTNFTIDRRRFMLGVGAATVAASWAQMSTAHAAGGTSLFGLPLAELRVGGPDNYPGPVQAAQYLLRSHTPGLAADGSFGPKTAATVSRMQSAHGLTKTGRISNGSRLAGAVRPAGAIRNAR